MYETSSRELNGLLRIAGFGQLAAESHSLRIRGATSYANALNGGEIIAMFMAAWRSEARRLYMWACAALLDIVLVELARQEVLELSGRPGPLRRSSVRDLSD